MEEWNLIGVYDDALSAEDCQSLIDIFERFDAEGKTEQGLYGKEHNHDPKVKDSRDLTIFVGREGMAPVTMDEGRMVLRLVHTIWGRVLDYFHRVDHMVNRPSWVESAPVYLYPSNFIIKRYIPPSQGFHAWHPDNGPLNQDRLLVALLYLNDVEEGGETKFYHQDFACKPKTGRLVIFPAGFTHIHQGSAPISNTKYIVNGWINIGEHWLPPRGD